MNNVKLSPTRKVNVHVTDNGTPIAHSTTSHKNIKVNAEVQPPLQLPGLIIFVHGVNSEGEWYTNAEQALCDGLNKRLGLKKLVAIVSKQMNMQKQNGAMKNKRMDYSSSKNYQREILSGDPLLLGLSCR